MTLSTTFTTHTHSSTSMIGLTLMLPISHRMSGVTCGNWDSRLSVFRAAWTMVFGCLSRSCSRQKSRSTYPSSKSLLSTATTWKVRYVLGRLCNLCGRYHTPVMTCFKPMTLPCSDQGYLIVASGMAVHSFASIGEIQQTTSDEEKQAVSDKVLTESRTFDTELRKAVTKRDAAERKAALLKLEDLYEFKRSHPTVEVSFVL